MIDSEKFDALVNARLEGYDAWDGHPDFAILVETPDGGLGVDIIYLIAGIVLTDDTQPDVLLTVALRHMAQCVNPGVLAGAMLTFEAWAVAEPGTDASPDERARFDRDRRTRGFHARPDRKETAMALCVDVWGRRHSTSIVRGEPGFAGMVAAGGTMFDRVARATTALAEGRRLVRGKT